MSVRGNPAGWLLLRIALACATARALFLIAGYFLQRFHVQRHHIEASLFIVAALAIAALLIQREPEETGAAVEGPPVWSVLAGALIIAFVLYWPALRTGFLSDDFVLADRALRGELVAPGHEFVRPVPLGIWRLLLMTGAGATVIHALNVLLHGVNSALTARLARRMGAGRIPALVAALLFLVWPTQVESVTWASGVFDVMMTTLVLALVNVYFGGILEQFSPPSCTSHGKGRRVPPEFSWRRGASIVLLALLALLTKETAAAVPVLLLLVSVPRWMTKPPSRSELTAFATVTFTCAAYMIWRVVLRPSAGGSPHPALTRYGVKELLSRTFGTLAVPFTTEWSAAAPLVATAFAFAIVSFAVIPIVSARLRGQPARTILAALIWPAIAAAPALGYLYIGANLEGSRYLYLPMAGWAIFLAVTAERTAALGRWLLPVVAVCGVAGVGVSVLHSRSLIADWSAAAAHRDAILREATRSVEQSACRSAHFVAAPDSYRGAQLFKNGLDEAVRASMVKPAKDAPDGQPCELTWDGAHFVRH
jgi:hypothetical protein